MTVVGILVGPGRRMFDVSIAREVYSDRSDLGLPRAEVRILASRATTDLDGVTTLHRTHGLSGINGLDLLIVPGRENPLADPGRADVEAVTAAAESGVTVASLCTGAFTLAAAGLLDGRTATTHWRFTEELARRHPSIDVRPRDLYCGSGGVWTSAGVTAGVDLLLHLVREGWGMHAAEVIARSMVTPVFRPGTQAQYADTRTPVRASATVEHLHLTVSKDLSRRWSVDDLAELCAMSPRTFQRWCSDQIGTSAITWLNDLRVREAQRLLERTDLPITAVSHAVGYASDDLLRKHFGARLHTTPSAHRALFRHNRSPWSHTTEPGPA